jgi:hypothetical protein
MKICLMGAELFHADSRTGRHDEANSRFRNFANAPKKTDDSVSIRHARYVVRTMGAFPVTCHIRELQKCIQVLNIRTLVRYI